MIITRSCSITLLTTLTLYANIPLAHAAAIPPQVYFDSVTQEDWSCFMITGDGQAVDLESMCPIQGNSSEPPGISSTAKQLIEVHNTAFCDPRPESQINPSDLTPILNEEDRLEWRRNWARYRTRQRSLTYFPANQNEKRNSLLDTEVFPNVIKLLEDCR